MNRILILLFTFCIAANASPDADFSKANADYAAGKYTDAKQGYEALVRSGDYAANLFYNLGNANWRLKDAGAATLAYQRALALAPSHTEAASNLNFVHQQTGAKTFRNHSWEALFPRLSLNALAWLAVCCGWLAVLLLLGTWLRWLGDGTWSGVTAVIALIASAYFAVAVWHGEQLRSVSIVTASNASARYAPADNSPLADQLPAGSEVRVLQDSGSWSYCVLPGDIRAWLPSNTIESVTPHRI